MEKYIEVFTSTFGISGETAKTSSFKQTKQWDSVGHVNLMAAIEAAFDISLEPDDILDFRSFAVGHEILKKYGVSL